MIEKTRERIREKPVPEASVARHVVRLRHPGRWISAVIIIGLAIPVVNLFATNPNIDWSIVANNQFGPTILAGIVETMELTIISMAIAIGLGIILAVMRLSHNPVLVRVSWLFVWFFRSTPVLVQLIFWYNFALLLPTLSLSIPFGPNLASVQTNSVISGFTAAVLGLSLHYAAYMAEVVRAGISSVNPGQREAASALGMSSTLTMRRVVLPQAMRVIIPPTGNEFLSLLKTTSLVSVIGGGDLLTRAQEVYSHTFRVIELLIVASIWYLVITSVMSVGQYYIERYFGRGSAATVTRHRRWKLPHVLQPAKIRGHA